MLTDEEARAVQQGFQAEALLADPTFNEVMDSLAKHWADQFFTSSPDQQAGRERAYQAYSSLADIFTVLRDRVAAKVNIEHMQAQREAAEAEQE